MAKKTKTTDSPVKEDKNVPKKSYGATRDVIIRVWRVIVASSIAYADVVIVMGTNGIIPKLMLIPATIFGAYLLIKR